MAFNKKEKIEWLKLTDLISKDKKLSKKQLIEKGYWQDECSVCGYNEVNIATDTCCLAVDFTDGDVDNWLLDNIRLLCANCFLSFNGWFYNSKRFCK